jgi:hypothetical protein
MSTKQPHRVGRSRVLRSTGTIRRRPPDRCILALESLEPREVPSAVSVNAGQVVRTATDQVLGTSFVSYDAELSTPQTLQMVQAAGLRLFRLSDGSGADEWHFNSPPAFDGAATAATLAALTEQAGAGGMVTIDYGSGSPTEGAAYLAYLNGSPTNSTNLGVDMQWSQTARAWVPVDWKTAGYWAGLRAANPLPQDDGLNFLRIGHAAPFGFKYFEVGNEVYGVDWEPDHHSPSHHPPLYVSFAKQFADLAAQIDPTISIGLGVGSPGNEFYYWTYNVLSECAKQGFVPGFLSDHNYMYDPGQEDDARLLLHTVTDRHAYGAGPVDWAKRANQYRKDLHRALGHDASRVQLLCTEFNSVSSTPVSNQTTSLVNGLFVADALGSILQTEYNSALFWDFRNTYYETDAYNPSLYGWRHGGDYGMLGAPNGRAPETGPYIAYPAYFAEQLVSKMVHTGDTVVWARTDNPYLTTYAVQQQNGHLDLLVINKSPQSDDQATIQIAGFVPSGQSTLWQYGKAEDNAQRDSRDGSASLSQTNPILQINDGSFPFTFPSYSMSVLDLAPATAPGPDGAETNRGLAESLYTAAPRPALIPPPAVVPGFREEVSRNWSDSVPTTATNPPLAATAHRPAMPRLGPVDPLMESMVMEALSD